MKMQRIARCCIICKKKNDWQLKCLPLSLILDMAIFQFVWNFNGTQSLYAVPSLDGEETFLVMLQKISRVPFRPSVA